MAAGERLRLRSIALIEAAKGLGAFAAAIALALLPVHEFAARASIWLARGARGAAMHLADDAVAMLDRYRWPIVVFVIAYAALRIAEGWGLWREREWARWLGLASAAIYVPFEIWHLIRTPGWVALLMLVLNLAVIWTLWPSARAGRN